MKCHSSLTSAPSVRRKNETISFAVFEHGVSAPRLFLWRTFEFYAALLQFGIRLLDVVARVRHVHERPDPFFISLRRKQHHACFRFRDPQLDPALLFVERLICNNRESEFVGVKVERAVLVGYGNANELDLVNHDAGNLNGSTCSRPAPTATRRNKMLSIYRYSDCMLDDI